MRVKKLILAVGGIAIATLVTALGALALAAAAVIVPFAAMRLSLFMLTGAQGFGGLMAAGSNAINLIGGGFSLLLSPVGLFVAAIVAAGVLIYKYWEPIKAFFGGFWDGFTSALAPIGMAFSATFAPVAPIFDGISNAVSKVWSWFKELLSPVQLSTEELKSCTKAGQVFGEVVGKAISALFFPIQQVAKGLGWILEKLGVIPSAAEAAADAARAMGVDPNEKDPFKVLNSVSAYAGKTAKANEQSQKQQAEATSKITNSVTVAGKQLEKNSELQQKANDVNPSENAEKYGTLVYDGAEKKSKTKGSKSALSDAVESVDRNKLGDIVFKNIPVVTAVNGLYQEPRIAARKTSLFPQFNDALINTLAPIQPKLNAVPVAVSPTRPERQIMQPEYNTFELNFYGVDMSNKKEIADIVKQQLTTLLRERDSRRRSSLKDQD
ncbi:hypothetical protein [Providencia rettgeri]|uniref:hypothetical protein n=1 Tax=Providencia rettgeri TaxID=587 RepID=UPI00384E2F1C